MESDDMPSAEASSDPEPNTDERRLEESCNPYFELYEHAPLGYLTVDRGGTIQAGNVTACRLLGVARKELVGRTLQSFIPQQHADTLRCFLRDLPNGGGGSGCDLSLNTSEDGRRPVSLRVEVAASAGSKDAGGAAQFCLSLFDQSKLVEALAQLRDRSRYLDGLVNAADAIVLELDAQGDVVFYNPFAEQLLGVPLDEGRGKSWFDTFLPPRDSVRIGQVFRDVMHSGEIRGNINPIVTADGTERWVQWSGKTLTDEHGHATGLLSVGIDITEQHRAELAAHRHAARLDELIRTTQDAVVFIDADSRICEFNAAAETMFGYTAQEIRGREVTLLMPQPYADEHDGYIRQYERTGEARAIGRIRVVTAKRRNGETFPIELSVVALSPNEVRYAAFIRDISERVRLQEKVVQQERLAAVGATAAIFAHEVGNPLNNMHLYAQLIHKQLESNNPDYDVRSDLNTIMGEVQRLNRLLDEFRQIYRRETPRAEHIEVGPIIVDVCRLQRQSLRYAGSRIAVECNVDDKLPALMGNADRLKQVLINLCKNAAEAMPEGGTLDVNASADTDTIRIEVRDTGIGIPSDIDVFQPFRTTKSRGTGLGLPLVKQIVSDHRGNISYESEPEQGTTFTIVLPAAAMEAKR